MNQLEVIEYIEQLLNNGEVEVSASKELELKEGLQEVYKTVCNYYRESMIKELQSQDNDHYINEYDSWYDWFEAEDNGNIKGILQEVITEEECDTIWNEYHK